MWVHSTNLQTQADTDVRENVHLTRVSHIASFSSHLHFLCFLLVSIRSFVITIHLLCLDILLSIASVVSVPIQGKPVWNVIQIYIFWSLGQCGVQVSRERKCNGWSANFN